MDETGLYPPNRFNQRKDLGTSSIELEANIQQLQESSIETYLCVVVKDIWLRESIDYEEGDKFEFQDDWAEKLDERD